MSPEDMAAAIAFQLDRDSWKATAVWSEIEFTNEDGENFRLTVDAVERFDDQ